jgi:ribonucleoside-diphosphate reductase alpha chain
MNTNTRGSVVPEKIKSSFKESEKYFPTQLQQFQFFDKYSRFDWDKGHRETWMETVDRSVDFLKELSLNKLSPEEYSEIRQYILEMKATPSMRLLAMAGKAARRQNVCIYNCSFMPVDSIDAWVEALIISMSGCGVGFSVEKQFVDKLPFVISQTNTDPINHVIEDTTEGWAKAVKTGLESWFDGHDIAFDYSQIRPAGAVLKVKGGRASGPEPLKKMLDFARKVILNAQGRKLTSLEAHDIMCEVGNAAVSGGMRRTAMISLFDFDDDEMRNCKNGDLTGNEQRWNANNSAVWPATITDTDIKRQFKEMDEGQRGEPGIFSRDAARSTMPTRRLALGEEAWGTNPCGEIVLRPYEFCNLTIAVARPDDTIETLKDKVRVASIIGTIQSMGTDFPGLRPQWKKNCEEERLLGVDITGQLDCPIFNQMLQDDEGYRKASEAFKILRDVAVETNRVYAQRLGINQSASVTCVKPSGNSSQLFGCSSGLHARHFPYYIRNVRVSAHSPIFSVLKDAGVPMDPENGQKAETAETWVIHFPAKSPDGGKIQDDMTVEDQCNVWLNNKLNWTEHNPSCTITYKPDELEALTNWVIKNKDNVGGLSFLPRLDAKYDQMPYEPISEKQYNVLLSEFPAIDFSRLYIYELEDYTKAAQELACMSGACEIDYQPNANASTGQSK